MSQLTLLVPSHNRPRELIRLLCSIAKSPINDFNIFVCIDNDEVETKNYRYVIRSFTDLHVNLIEVPEVNTWAERLNVVRNHIGGDYILYMPDDYAFLYADWLEKLTRQIDANLVPRIIHMNDFSMHPDQPSIFAISRKIVDVLGYYMNDYFPYWFCDTWWEEIGRMTGLLEEARWVYVYPPDGRGETMGGVADLELWWTLFQRTRFERLSDARKLIEAFNLKVTERGLQRMASYCNYRMGKLEEWLAQWPTRTSTDPRYLRVKAKAESKLRGIENENEI